MSEHEKVVFHGAYVDIAENKHYLELENVVCYFNYPNGNMRQMDYGTTEEEHSATLERAKTLCLMPVYAKCAKNRKGQPTFKGHEVKVKNGELEFDTIPIGVHSDVRIEEREVVAVDGTAHKLPVLIAKQRIWKRNKNAVAAIQRLFAEGKLFNSWEVEVTQYSFKEGIKYLEEFSFLGNAFLGYEFAKPAFGTASAVISVAEELDDSNIDCEMMIAEALYLDQQDSQDEDPSLGDENKGKIEVSKTMENEIQEVMTEPEALEVSEEVVPVEVAEESEEVQPTESEGVEVSTDEPETTEDVTEEQPPVEVSAMTEQDVHRALNKAFGEEGYPAFIFPGEKEALFHRWKDKELDFISVKYEITGDVLTITERKPVTLAVSPRNVGAELSTRDERIATLEQEVSELADYKTKFEAAEAEKQKAAKLVKQDEMATMAKKSGLFTAKEIASEPISKMIDNTDESGLKVYIAERLMASRENTVVETSEAAPSKSLEGDGELTPGQRLMAALGIR